MYIECYECTLVYLVSFKFGMWTVWGWHSLADTCWSNDWPYGCVCHMCICLVL